MDNRLTQTSHAVAAFLRSFPKTCLICSLRRMALKDGIQLPERAHECAERTRRVQHHS